MKSSFETFLNKNYIMLIDSGLFDVFRDLVKFQGFCIQDLFNKTCLIKTNLTQIQNNFKEKFEILKNYDLKNESNVYAEDLIRRVKDVQNIVLKANDMITNVDLNSNFDGLTSEYIFDLENLNKYLNNKKVINITDFEFNKNTTEIDIKYFERDFTNLIRSTEFICHNIMEPFFYR
jgi:hypothetical protein